MAYIAGVVRNPHVCMLIYDHSFFSTVLYMKNKTKTLNLCFLTARLEILSLNSGTIKGTPQVSVHDNRELLPSALTFLNNVLTLTSSPIWAVSLGCLWYSRSCGWQHFQLWHMWYSTMHFFTCMGDELLARSSCHSCQCALFS